MHMLRQSGDQRRDLGLQRSQHLRDPGSDLRLQAWQLLGDDAHGTAEAPSIAELFIVRHRRAQEGLEFADPAGSVLDGLPDSSPG